MRYLPRILRSTPWLIALLTPIGAMHAAPVTRTLDVPVSASQTNAQMTPVAVHDGHVFVATVEPGPSGDGPGSNDLRIAVRQGVPNGSGGYVWTKQIVETSGVFDIWHTAPAIGVDEAGYVYTAAVPGNQITYPHFANDREGKLYLTYRFAAKPGRSYAERTFSTGMDSYDAGSRTWRSIGELLDYAAGDHTGPATAEASLRAFASAPGWTSYLARPTFGPDGEFSVSTLWRAGTAGATTVDSCVFRTRDGEAFSTLAGAAVPVPIKPGNCPNVTSAVAGAAYLSLGDAASDRAGHPYLVISPGGRDRELHRWNSTRWLGSARRSARWRSFSTTSGTCGRWRKGPRSI